GVALRRLEERLHSKMHTEVVADVEREMSREKPDLIFNPVGVTKAEEDGAGLA
ncbi:MAG: hypothetical protein JO210_15325, partial [Acidobacteriaceae bacterium]|nr:hypothetical protein [Acidobacteriaceae bacterium]